MARAQAPGTARKFAGIVLPEEVTKRNFLFLFVNTFIMGMFMTVPAVIQPAFMSDIVKIDPAYTGSVNSFLQNMSQVATLAFVALIGAFSDRVGRKKLVFIAFVCVGLSYLLFSNSVEVAAVLGIGPGPASRICAALSLMPAEAARFEAFAPGLLVSYAARLLIGISLILGYPQLIAMYGDYVARQDRGKAMALYGTGVGLAAVLVFGIFGPIIKKAGVVVAIETVVLLSVAGAAIALFFMKDRMPETGEERGKLREVLPLLKGSKVLKAAFVSALVTRADIIVLSTYLVSWGVRAAGSRGMDLGTATMRASIPMMLEGLVALAAFPVIGSMVDRKGRMPTLLFSVASATLGMLLLAFAPDPFSPLCILAAALIGVGHAGCFTGSNSLALDGAPMGMTGAVLGGVNTMQPIGVLFFLVVGGVLFDKVSPGSAFLLKAVAGALLFVWLLAMSASVTKEISPVFTMDWEESARHLMLRVPGGIRQTVIELTEGHAREKGAAVVTAEICKSAQG